MKSRLKWFQPIIPEKNSWDTSTQSCFFFWPISSSSQCCLPQLTHQILHNKTGRLTRVQTLKCPKNFDWDCRLIPSFLCLVFEKSCLILDVIMNQNIAGKMFSSTSAVRQNWYLTIPCSTQTVKITLLFYSQNHDRFMLCQVILLIVCLVLMRINNYNNV